MHGDPFDRKIEVVGADLGQGRLESLAHRGAAGEQIDGVPGMHRDARRLRRPGAAAFHEAGETRAEVAAIVAASAVAPLAIVADRLQQALEQGGIISVVVDGAGLARHQLADVVGQLFGAQKVAPAQLGPVQSKLRRRDVEQALAEEVALEPARAAIGADRGLVGDIGLDGAGEVIDTVRSRQELGGLRRNDAAVGTRVSTHVAPHGGAHPEDSAVPAKGDGQRTVDLARVVRRHEMLAAVLDPGHGPAQPA